MKYLLLFLLIFSFIITKSQNYDTIYTERIEHYDYINNYHFITYKNTYFLNDSCIYKLININENDTLQQILYYDNKEYSLKCHKSQNNNFFKLEKIIDIFKINNK